MKKTKADEEVIAVIPKGWFMPYDLPPHIRCPSYRCERLKELGVLQSRSVGEIPYIELQYNKIA